ncbi:MAG: SPOR domain-containing protein [Paludibacter sp.]
MNFRFLSFLAVLCLSICVLSAQENNENTRTNIFRALRSTDTTTNATVQIHQDKRIESLLVNKKVAAQALIATGFRIQVFSSNIQKTAKNNAFEIEKQIQNLYPELPVYVNYTSPFWKVRVGDFRTKADAQMNRNKLIESFPNLKSEIYVVPDQINVTPPQNTNDGL